MGCSVLMNCFGRCWFVVQDRCSSLGCGGCDGVRKKSAQDAESSKTRRISRAKDGTREYEESRAHKGAGNLQWQMLASKRVKDQNALSSPHGVGRMSRAGRWLKGTSWIKAREHTSVATCKGYWTCDRGVVAARQVHYSRRKTI